MNSPFTMASDVSPRGRAAVLAVIAVLTCALAYVQAQHPALALRPLLLVGIIAYAVLGGWWAGVVYALATALVFSFIENAGAPASSYPVALGLPTLACVGTSLLVSAIVAHARYNRALSRKLAFAEAARAQLEDIETARALSARTEANYRALGESIPFGIWQVDAGGRFTYVSEQFRELCAMSLAQIENGEWTSRIVTPDGNAFLENWTKRDESPSDLFEGDYKLRAADGRIVAVLSRGVRLRDFNGRSLGWVGFNLDVTDRRRALDAVSFWEELGAQLMRSLDPPTILDRVAALCIDRIADWCIIDVVDEHGELRHAVARHANEDLVAEMYDMLDVAFDPAAANGGPAAVLRTSKSELYVRPSNDGDARGEREGAHLELLRAIGYTSAIIVPLISRQRAIGTVTLVSSESGRRYDAQDLVVAQVMGARTALAYDNARLYARERRVADTLQHAMLPAALPVVPGVEIDGTYLPGSADSEVGGDWYDAFLLPDGRVGITIGDVAGKGLRAAAAMGLARQALRAAAFDGLTPAASLARVNRQLCHERTGMVTAVSAIFDPRRSALRYAGAGHPPPIVAAPDGTVTSLEQSGIALGLFLDASFVEHEIGIGAGAMAVFYTDGLTELNRDIAAGERALAEAAAAEINGDAEDRAVAIRQRIVVDRPKDDVAVLTLKTSTSPVDRLDVEAPATPASSGVLRQALRRLAGAAGLDEKRSFPLLVAAGEAISNVIEHAYAFDDEGTVHVSGRVDERRLIVEIADRGAWRAPRDEGRGRGLPLIRSLVDSADISVDGSGTTVRLAVRIDGGS